MAEKMNISVKTAVIYGLAVVAVAFIGVVAGNWFVQWRNPGYQPPSPEDWAMSNRTALNQGDQFPVENLCDLDSNIVSMADLIEPQTTLLLFISPGCGPCKMAIESWKEEVDDIGGRFSVIGIAAGGVAEVAAYVKATEFPFPMYVDVDLLYVQQYDLSSFPTVVGLDDSSQVGCVLHGFNADFGLADAVELMDKQIMKDPGESSH